MEFFTDPDEPRILLVWPRLKVVEDHAAALQTRAFIYAHMRGPKGVVVVFLDRIVGLDRGAREVHMGAYGELVLGVAYVGATPLSRALLGFAIGLQRNVAPVRLFGSFEQGRSWCLELLDQADRAEVRP